jgi:hypothetical protein
MRKGGEVGPPGAAARSPLPLRRPAARVRVGGAPAHQAGPLSLFPLALGRHPLGPPNGGLFRGILFFYFISIYLIHPIK